MSATPALLNNACDRSVDRGDRRVDRRRIRQVGREERSCGSGRRFDVEHGDVGGAELGEQVEQRRTDAGRRPGDDDALAVVHEWIAHGVLAFTKGWLMLISPRAHRWKRSRVGAHVLEDFGFVHGEFLIAVLHRERGGDARRFEVVPEHFLRAPQPERREAGDLLGEADAASSSSSSAQTRDTRPMRSASAASTLRPVRIMSNARAAPTRRGRK